MVSDVEGVAGRLVGVIVTKVPVPAAGTAPALDDRVGVVPAAYITAYPACVAPEPGKLAAVNDTPTDPDPLTVAEAPLACDVGGALSVRKLTSLP